MSSLNQREYFAQKLSFGLFTYLARNSHIKLLGERKWVMLFYGNQQTNIIAMSM